MFQNFFAMNFLKRGKLNHWQNFYYVSCLTESIFASDAFSVLYKFQLYKTFNKKVFLSDANWLKYIPFKIKNVFRINDILKIANIRAQLKTTHCECEFFASWQKDFFYFIHNMPFLCAKYLVCSIYKSVFINVACTIYSLTKHYSETIFCNWKQINKTRIDSERRSFEALPQEGAIVDKTKIICLSYSIYNFLFYLVISNK